jgi:hypothetical protein
MGMIQFLESRVNGDAPTMPIRTLSPSAEQHLRGDSRGEICHARAEWEWQKSTHVAEFFTLAHHLRVSRIVLDSLSPWMLLIPALSLLVVWSASGSLLPWFVGKYAYTGKDLQEIVGPSLLAAALCVALFQTYSQRQFRLQWLASLTACFLCREWHFPGTSTGVYVGLVALAGYASLEIDRLSPLLRHRLTGSLLTGALATYVIAISVDHGVWKLLPHWQMWSINLEETLESAGHALILGTVLSAGIIRVGRGARRAARAPAATPTSARALAPKAAA